MLSEHVTRRHMMLIGATLLIAACSTADTGVRDEDASRYLYLHCGRVCADGSGNNQWVKNTHTGRGITGTFDLGDGKGTINWTLAPGGDELLSYCNCNRVKVVGARFIN